MRQSKPKSVEYTSEEEEDDSDEDYEYQRKLKQYHLQAELLQKNKNLNKEQMQPNIPQRKYQRDAKLEIPESEERSEEEDSDGDEIQPTMKPKLKETFQSNQLKQENNNQLARSNLMAKSVDLIDAKARTNQKYMTGSNVMTMSRPTTASRQQTAALYTFKLKRPTTAKLKANDPVARYQQMAKTWRSDRFLSGGANHKEGRKLELDKRTKGVIN